MVNSARRLIFLLALIAVAALATVFAAPGVALAMPAATAAVAASAKPIHGGQAQPGAVIPFVKASFQFAERFFTDTFTLSTSQQSATPKNITPGGYLRGVYIEMNGASGALGTAVVGSDFPTSLFATITLEDVNGAPIVGPLEGWTAYALNKYGGLFFNGDPSIIYNFRGSFVNPYFMLWIPCEARSDGLGSLSNTDARSQYRLNYTIDSSTNILSTGTVTTQPTLTVGGFVEYWAQPEPTDLMGTAQEQKPPFLGTTMFASREVVVSGLSNGSSVTAKHNRVGNQIRFWMYIVRTGAAATGAEQINPRADLLADPIRIRLDNRYLRVESPNLRRGVMARKYGLSGGFQTPGTGVGIVDTGAYVYSFNDGLDYHPSPADDGGWLPTTEASFLQLEGTITGAAGSANNITVLTNDVAVKGAVAGVE